LWLVTSSGTRHITAFPPGYLPAVEWNICGSVTGGSAATPVAPGGMKIGRLALMSVV